MWLVFFCQSLTPQRGCILFSHVKRDPLHPYHYGMVCPPSIGSIESSRIPIPSVPIRSYPPHPGGVRPRAVGSIPPNSTLVFEVDPRPPPMGWPLVPPGEGSFSYLIFDASEPFSLFLRKSLFFDNIHFFKFSTILQTNLSTHSRRFGIPMFHNF